MKLSPLPARTRIGSLVALLTLSLAAAFCKGREVPDGQCVFNSDCDNNYVCAGKVCRQPCNSRPCVSQAERDRDCPSNTTCRPGDESGSYACYPRDVPYRCVYHSECNQAAREICARDGFCRAQCVSDYDCYVATLNLSSRCVPTGDAGPAGTCDFRFDDAGTGDASASDASSGEASASDGATPDAASSSRDSGTTDAAVSDAAVSDAAVSDAAVSDASADARPDLPAT